MLKQERQENDYLEADMWCHFGTAIIRGPGEGNTSFLAFSWIIRRKNTNNNFSLVDGTNILHETGSLM